MEGDSSVLANGSSNTSPVPVVADVNQTSEESKSSPIPSMSGALQGGDVNESLKTADEADGM